MMILFVSTVFPNATYPSRVCFNDSLVRPLVIGPQVEIVSPILQVDLLNQRPGISHGNWLAFPTQGVSSFGAATLQSLSFLTHRRCVSLDLVGPTIVGGP